VRELGVYADAVPYEEIRSLPAGRAVLVDLAGDADLRAAVHCRYQRMLAHSCVAGATHWQGAGPGRSDLPGPLPSFLFAPERIAKRTRDWGRAAFESRLAAAWNPFERWSAGWLGIKHGRGPEAVESAYLEVLRGESNPATAHVLTMSSLKAPSVPPTGARVGPSVGSNKEE
jgi:hypothetical protein